MLEHVIDVEPSSMTVTALGSLVECSMELRHLAKAAGSSFLQVIIPATL